MAGRLNIIGDVATESDVPELLRVQVIVRNNVATISRVGELLAEKPDVTAVEQIDSRAWMIRFADGVAWAARIPGNARPGCGCR